MYIAGRGSMSSKWLFKLQFSDANNETIILLLIQMNLYRKYDTIRVGDDYFVALLVALTITR